MKNVTANVQIQFDVFSDDIKEEVINSLVEMSKVLGERFPDRSPIIFTNSIDDSDFEVHTPEDEEIDASEGVETNYGYIEVHTAMIEDENGTDLHEGVDVRLDGDFIGEVIGGSKYFDSIDDLEAWYLKHFDK